jgi:ribosomal protection tetracycline resistance protein
VPTHSLNSSTLNLGILAHVDAGKTSLTERLLFDNGAIAELGSVDAGSTQTDTSELERQRGITIRSAVACFTTCDLQVNLVDTPGHPDFIAEVERALSVLDGAVLVVSAVEGVQAQTRILMRSLTKMRLPTLIFVNKVDRMGARSAAVVSDIRRKLSLSVLPMTSVLDEGTPHARVVAATLDDNDFRTQAAEIVADNDHALLARLVEGRVPSSDELRERIIEQTMNSVLHPVFVGSALSGAGTRELTDGIGRLLRMAPISTDTTPRGTVFAIERIGRGEKVAYVRLFSGEVHARDRLTFRRREPNGRVSEFTARITGLDVVGAGHPTAGNIARLRGVREIRVGDTFGESGDRPAATHFSPPSLETVVRARHPGQVLRLHAALTSLADEDPFIRTRPAGNGATSVLLYGAVQKEVVEERLRREYGVDAEFEPIRPVYFERPASLGEALREIDRHGSNDFWATIGLRVEPAAHGGGNRFTRQVRFGALPAAFHRAIEDAVFHTLAQGLHGWEVTDCDVTLYRVGYMAPSSVAADFRHLTPIVLMRALRAAGTQVYEPCQAFEVEVPGDVLSSVISHLVALEATIGQPAESKTSWHLTGAIPTRRMQDLTLALPGLSHGEGTLWSRPGPDRPVRGAIPRRERFEPDPLDHDEYMRFLANRNLGAKRNGAIDAPRASRR